MDRVSTCGIFCEFFEISENFPKINFLDAKSYILIKENKNDVEIYNKIEISLKFENFRVFSRFAYFLCIFCVFFAVFRKFDYNRLHEASPAQTG